MGVNKHVLNLLLVLQLHILLVVLLLCRLPLQTLLHHSQEKRRFDGS